jgi:hypothetical protein
MFMLLMAMIYQAPIKTDISLGVASSNHIFNSLFEYSVPNFYWNKNETSIYRFDGKKSILVKKIDFRTKVMERTDNEWIFGTYKGEIILYSKDFDLKKIVSLPDKEYINGIKKINKESAVIIDAEGKVYKYDLKLGSLKHIYNGPSHPKIKISKNGRLLYVYNGIEIVCFNLDLNRHVFTLKAEKPIFDIFISSDQSQLFVAYIDSGLKSMFFTSNKVYKEFDTYDAKEGHLIERKMFSNGDDVISCTMGNGDIWIILASKEKDLAIKRISPKTAPQEISKTDLSKFDEFKRNLLSVGFTPLIYDIGNDSVLVWAFGCFLVEKIGIN